MISPTRTPHRLVPVAGPDTISAFGRALDGGPAVAPLPSDAAQAAAALRMLQPDRPLEADGVAAVVATSGSTGEPKGVLLTRAAIRASAAATHERLGGPGRWLLALPVHYVAGLMVAARSLLAGTEPRSVGSDLAGLLEPDVLDGAGRRYLSVVPTQLVRALEDPALAEALAGLDAVLVGGGPVAEPVLARAKSAGIRTVTTYGMSETCGGCVYDGTPLDGVRVALDERSRVRLAGPTLFSGYRLRPEPTAHELGAHGFLTSDRGRWAAGRLDILGRVDDVVIVGGHNVDLAAVERVLQPLGEVIVIGTPDPEWGNTVVAVTAQRVTLDDVRGVSEGRLAGHAVPRDLVLVDALPRTGSGKVDRPALRELIRRRQGRCA